MTTDEAMEVLKELQAPMFGKLVLSWSDYYGQWEVRLVGASQKTYSDGSTPAAAILAAKAKLEGE